MALFKKNLLLGFTLHPNIYL